MWILKIMAIGFFTGIGWERLVIEPYLKPKEHVEAKNENQS